MKTVRVEREVKQLSIAKKFLQFSIGPCVSAFIAFITTPILTWIILPENFGKAAMFTLAYNLLVQLTLLGTDQSFIRMFYEKDEDHRHNLLLNSVFPSLLFFSFILAIIILAWQDISILLVGLPDELSVILLSVSVLAGILTRFSLLIIRMNQRGILYSMVTIVGTLTNASVVIFWAVFIDSDFTAILYGFCISQIVMFAFAFYFERVFWAKISIRLFDFSMVKEILRYGIPFVPTLAVACLVESVDKLVLRSLVSFEAMGIYASALKLTSVLGIIQTSFSSFWIPVAFKHFDQNPQDTSLFKMAMNILSAVLITIALFIILAKDLIVLILGEPYREAARLLPLLIFQPIMFTISEITSSGINFAKKTSWHFGISTTTAIIYLFFSIVLINVLGITAVALATSISYITLFYARTTISNRYFRVEYDLSKFAVATLVLLIVAVLNTFNINQGLEVASSLLGILILIILYRKDLIYAGRTLYLLVKKA